MYSHTDYTKEEVSDSLNTLEQWQAQERNPVLQKALLRSIAIMRAVNKIGKGTAWLSELSGT